MVVAQCRLDLDLHRGAGAEPVSDRLCRDPGIPAPNLEFGPYFNAQIRKRLCGCDFSETDGDSLFGNGASKRDRVC